MVVILVPRWSPAPQLVLGKPAQLRSNLRLHDPGRQFLSYDGESLSQEGENV